MSIRTIERLLVPSNTKTAKHEIAVVYTDQQVKGILGAVLTWINTLAVPPIERKKPTDIHCECPKQRHLSI